MTEYSFGKEPIADKCSDVLLNCMYDEIFIDKQPLQRWFEVEGGTPLFDISVDPVDYNELMTKQFSTVEVLPAAPEAEGAQEDFVPKNIAFDISYY